MALGRQFGSRAIATLLMTVLPAIAWSTAFAFSDSLITQSGRESPAVITDNSRNPLIDDDFLREIYVPPGLKVTMLGKQTQIRTFFGNSTFYSPPITPREIADYAGGTTNPDFDLVVMRCKPIDTKAVDPELAIWPNVAKFLVEDLTPNGGCPGSSTADQAWCLANSFQDTSNKPLIISLYNAISFGKDLFSINNGDGANLLYDLYGIGYGHSGIGFVVKGSASGDFTATQTLVNSVVPEYLLQNVALGDADCHCVQIPSYQGRDDEPLSTNFVWNRGSLDGGACRKVKRIPR
jgi:hypothetical protein